MAHRRDQMRVWDKKSIQELLEKSDYAVERAILAIYQRQEEDEKQDGVTRKRNGVGFGAFDADYFSTRAVFLLSGQPLTPYLASRARVRGIGRYWRQLAEIANENEVRKMRKHES